MKRDFIKPAIKTLQAYEPEPQHARAILNANENPYDLPETVKEEIAEKIRALDFNRYPDPASAALIQAFSKFSGVPTARIMAGNGLDEVLSVMIQTFIAPGETLVSHAPGFSMYEVWTAINGGRYVAVPDTDEHKINTDGLIEAAIRNNAKMIVVCSPNNPTGYKIPKYELVRLLEESPSLVVLDEAYIDFDGDSYIDLLDEGYDNLVVLRTMSKAFRIPGARCGFACGPDKLIGAMKKVKAPYNLNALTQTAARTALEHADEILSVIPEIKQSRADMTAFLSALPDVNVCPSAANFIYFTTPRHAELQQSFLKNGILVRYYPDACAFRLTIGTPEENDMVRAAVQEVYDA